MNSDPITDFKNFLFHCFDCFTIQFEQVIKLSINVFTEIVKAKELEPEESQLAPERTPKEKGKFSRRNCIHLKSSVSMGEINPHPFPRNFNNQGLSKQSKIDISSIKLLRKKVEDLKKLHIRANSSVGFSGGVLPSIRSESKLEIHKLINH